AVVEAAEAVVPGAVQVIEQLRGLRRIGGARCKERVETLAMPVVQRLAVLHGDADGQAALQPAVEVDEVRIGVVEQRARWPQAQRHRQAAAEGLDQAPPRVRLPQRPQVWNLPPLASGPLERRTKRGRAE